MCSMRSGTLLGIGEGHTLWTRAILTSPWVEVPDSGSVIGVTALDHKTR